MTHQEVLQRTAKRINEREPGIDAREWCDRDCTWFTVARHLAGQIVEIEHAPEAVAPGWSEMVHRVLGQRGLLREAELAADLLAKAREAHEENR
jgi:hypothetical protein